MLADDTMTVAGAQIKWLRRIQVPSCNLFFQPNHLLDFLRKPMSEALHLLQCSLQIIILDLRF